MKEVTIIFKSGATASFTVEEFNTFKNGFGALEKIEYKNPIGKAPVFLDPDNLDAILVEEQKENNKSVVKQDDHPIEDVTGEEILSGETYFVFNNDIVLEHNLKNI
ncbi:hypothetical protein ACN5TA_000507 [Bacillus cytotoxicus]|uniref:Uncharacterized protein n=1 Tax=Bacillus cytotoxicus TaxID=580165 RepID=A0AAX2CNZ7_9BACI|nr:MULTISPECIES: hypothetical protein [unclassified Bacillus cereus group]SCM08433.1 Uncharacterized protein BCB44BAC_04601 [Bacillus cytotoxicus]